jgi:hypothetical protein
LVALGKLVFLGTPHHGSPLERGGNGLDLILDLSPYSAPLTRLGKARSAGMQDLRHGAITPGGVRPVPLPSGVECCAAAATQEASKPLGRSVNRRRTRAAEQRARPPSDSIRGNRHSRDASVDRLRDGASRVVVPTGGPTLSFGSGSGITLEALPARIF